MNLNQLQYFKVLAQEEHYTRAAQILSITQPSLSHAIAQLEQELRTRELNGSKEGIIHLAYIYTMGSNFTPKMVRNFLDTYQDYHIDFHFTVGTTGDILAGLKEDKYDIVFSSYQEGEPDIEFRKIGNQKLVVAVPQDHPLAIHGSVDLRDTIAPGH